MVEWVGSDRFVLTICIDDQCGEPYEFGLDAPIPADSILSLPLPFEGSSAVPMDRVVDMRLIAQVAGNSQVARGDIQLSTFRPNGPGREPECRSADLVVDGTELRLTPSGAMPDR